MVSREWSRALQGPLPALGKKAIEGEGRMLKWKESAALIVGVVMAAGAAAMPLPAEKGACLDFVYFTEKRRRGDLYGTRARQGHPPLPYRGYT